MSGTGTNDVAAPARLTPVAGDQPIGNGTDGSLVMPSFYFLQFLQRILSYIGQPTGNSGTTLTTQVVEATEAAQEAISQVSSVQNLTLSLQADLQSAARASRLPAAPDLGLTQAQVLARMTFTGGRW
jgi:hypothetical protein